MKFFNSTLFECLLTIVTLLAPSVPHFTEQIYQNLRAAYKDVPALSEESVHLLKWAVADPALIDKQLEDDIDIANVRIGTIFSSGFFVDY
jgi:isoleucyl-tRNA synthetase